MAAEAAAASPEETLAALLREAAALRQRLHDENSKLDDVSHFANVVGSGDGGRAAGAAVAAGAEAAARAEGAPVQGAVRGLGARPPPPGVLRAGRPPAAVGRLRRRPRARAPHRLALGAGLRLRPVRRARGGRRARQQGHAVGGVRRGGRAPRRGHAGVVRGGGGLPALVAPAAVGGRRRRRGAVGRGGLLHAARVGRARRGRHLAARGARRRRRRVRVGRRRPRRARVGRALAGARARLHAPRLGRDVGALPPVGRRAGDGLRRLAGARVGPARGPRAGALQPRLAAVRLRQRGVVGLGAAAVRGLRRPHGVRVGRAAGDARGRAVRPRAPRGARAAVPRPHGARHRLLGRHHPDLGLSASRASIKTFEY